MLACTSSPSTWENDTGGSWVQSQLCLKKRERETGYAAPCSTLPASVSFLCVTLDSLGFGAKSCQAVQKTCLPQRMLTSYRGEHTHVRSTVSSDSPSSSALIRSHFHTYSPGFQGLPTHFCVSFLPQVRLWVFLLISHRGRCPGLDQR